jgi:hypothetical protein
LPAAGSAVSTPAAHEPPAKARAVYFENPETVKEAWQEIARPELLSERGLERVLDVSGPVRSPVRRRSMSGSLRTSAGHPFIFRSLLHSAFDVYGDLDKKAARRLLAQLSLSRETAGLDELKQKLDLRG